MNILTRLVNEAAEILKQLKIVVEALPEKDYSLNLDIVEGNTIGMHIRHILEFYKSLEYGLNKEFVDYDARERNLELETNKNAALIEIERIQKWLNSICNNTEIKILHHSEKEMVLNSSISRELAYNIEHSIHHMAIIKICINASFANFKLDENFGLAYATIQYRAANHVHSKLPA
jgi:hypothetical protein